MKKLGTVAMKGLKILHLVLVSLFFGGILSSVALNSRLDLSVFEEVNATYKSLVILSDYIVRYGAQGTIVMGIIYGVWTNWGFFRHKWIAVKWAIFVAQTFLGILVVDKLMVANMALLTSEKAMALSNPVFIHNHVLRKYVVIVQMVLTLCLICISVLKPWKMKKA